MGIDINAAMRRAMRERIEFEKRAREQDEEIVTEVVKYNQRTSIEGECYEVAEPKALPHHVEKTQ